MNPALLEKIFVFSNFLTLPVWFAMVFFPTAALTRRVVASPWIVAPAALLYSVLVLPNMLALLPSLAQPTLPSIQTLLGTANGATIAWVHFLAFDVFVGRWIFLEWQQDNQSLLPWQRLWLSLVLVCVLMFGPFGALLHLLTRHVLLYAKPSKKF